MDTHTHTHTHTHTDSICIYTHLFLSTLSASSMGHLEQKRLILYIYILFYSHITKYMQQIATGRANRSCASKEVPCV